MIRYASNSSLSDDAGFKAFLQGQLDKDIPVTVVYPLVNEVTEYITLSEDTKALLDALDSSDKTIKIMDNVNDMARKEYIYCSKYSTGFYITSSVSGFKINF